MLKVLCISVAWEELMRRIKCPLFSWSRKHEISTRLQMAEVSNFSWPSGLSVQVQYQYEFKYFQLKASSSHETKIYVFDADHERRRKEQLKRIFERTAEQVLKKKWIFLGIVLKMASGYTVQGDLQLNISTWRVYSQGYYQAEISC